MTEDRELREAGRMGLPVGTDRADKAPGSCTQPAVPLQFKLPPQNLFVVGGDVHMGEACDDFFMR